MNEQALRQVIDALAAQPRQIQVLCPRGHFITTAGLSVEAGRIRMDTSRPFIKPGADEPRGAFWHPLPRRETKTWTRSRA